MMESESTVASAGEPVESQRHDGVGQAAERDGGGSHQTELKEIGARLRRARRAKRMRLRDLAEAVGCSESLLSKIECDKATPSLRTLHRIVAVLETSIATLFDDAEPDDVVFYRSGARMSVAVGGPNGDGGGSGSGIRLERLVPYREGRVLEGNIHVIAPGADNGGEIKHTGEEVGYVLEGEMELTVGETTAVLRQGDSFFFPSHLPHRYANRGESVCRVLWINTPPTF
jgi:quercetin dioxygenase-like cupin family protein/DNA-binding XRE family transcriptional regulator